MLNKQADNMIRRQEKYLTRAGVTGNNSNSVLNLEIPQRSHASQPLRQKTTMMMRMDSVIRGVSILNVFSASAKSSDPGGVCNMLCCNILEDHDENDGDTTTCLTLNETVSSSKQSSLEPTPVASKSTVAQNSMNSDLASRAMVQFPSLQKKTAAVCADAPSLSTRGSDSLQGQNNYPCQEDRRHRCDALDLDDEDPPLSCQTAYARQQLYQSRRYRDQRFITARGYYGTTDEDCHEDDDGEPLVDEVEISRGLGGYEEGFGIYDYYHDDLPSTILEEDEGEDDFSLSSKSRNQEESEAETLTVNSNTLVDCQGQQGGGSDKTATVCLYCQNGTCDNKDCSHSRFLI